MAGPAGGRSLTTEKDRPIHEPTFDVCNRDRTTVVSIAGELDIASAPLLRDCLTSVVNGGSWSLVLDFSKVDLVDSTALSVLIGVAKRVQSNAGEFSIRNVARSVMKTFTFTGMDETLGVTEAQ